MTKRGSLLFRSLPGQQFQSLISELHAMFLFSRLQLNSVMGCLEASQTLPCLTSRLHFVHPVLPQAHLTQARFRAERNLQCGFAESCWTSRSLTLSHASFYFSLQMSPMESMPEMQCRKLSIRWQKLVTACWSAGLWIEAAFAHSLVSKL